MGATTDDKHETPAPASLSETLSSNPESSISTSVSMIFDAFVWHVVPIGAVLTITKTAGADLPPAYAPAVLDSQTSAANNDRTEIPRTTSDVGPSSPSDPAGSSSSGSGLPSDVKPGNYILVSRQHESVKGTFVINPTLNVPEVALPPIPEGTDRDNIYLESSNRSVNANVHLYVPPGSMPEKSSIRASLKAKANHGGVTFRVVRGLHSVHTVIR
jgi:hypothetical protein